ncbi:MAG: trypsin-like peptidase domain-containing protein [Caldilineales bacterium]|nr:trypsin-like peptidase domain-containing protein [Caldilineales bacterium]MDW8316565.1 trypsin-like peptidase domain-containing protein [Anaerolineae bacterium]
MRTRTLRWTWLAGLAVVGLLAVMAATAPARAVSRDALNRALLATVRVAVPVEGKRDTYSTGSGTILSRDGYVLTNFHVMGDIERNKLYNRKGAAFIAINPTNLKGAPTWIYVAEMVKGDPKLDLALLKITGYMNSDDPLPASLPLTAIELGNSDDLAIGDELSVIGFPGLGGDTVTFTQGKVSGFLDEDGNGVFEWIKTDAEVNHGNSGGLAIDENGKMVGVPTAGYSDTQSIGKISLVRPINLALPLIRAGVATAQGPAPSAACAVEKHPDGAVITKVVFAEAVDRNGNPQGEAASFDSGIDEVYAVFDFSRFRNGREFRFSWYLDDEQVVDETVKWNGGASGRDWVNVFSDEGLPDGVYRLELRYDKKLLACGSFSVGETASASPVFGPITFAAGQRNDQPVDPGTQFPSGIREVFAFFDYEGMADGVSWRQVWYVDGEVGLDSEDTWDGGEAGSYWISVYTKNGLPDGQYLLELYVEGELVQSGEFAIGGGGERAPSQDEVEVVGVVVDANRRTRPIADATIVFLKPGVKLDQWLRNQREADIYTGAVTDKDGWFQLPDPLQRGQTYPVIVVADGYKPVAEPNFTVPKDAPDPYELTITLVRK